MKKLVLFISSIFFSLNSMGQTPSYQEKLYYTCKVWGYMKYFHSEVSTCKVNWDSILLSRLPAIKSAATNNDFNNELKLMMDAAGPMALATTPAPATLAPELRRNLNLDWHHDITLRADVQTVLDTIKNNFRPHASCWVADNDYTGSYGGWLVFPKDSLMLNVNISTALPNPESRTLLVFKYWNIINYFNPYNYVLDKNWDSTLYQKTIAVVEAPNTTQFYLAFKKMVSRLNDVHAEGLTSARYTAPPKYYYSPLILLNYVDKKYVVTKSDISGIDVGDAIDSINGISAVAMEDSLRPYISAGNESVFHRTMCEDILKGYPGTNATISYTDALGMHKTMTTLRSTYRYDNWFYDFYPNDSLASVSWKKLDCGIGYVNMGNLLSTETATMYSNLKSAPAIIFDIRNYPNGTMWDLLPLMLETNKAIAYFTIPDVNYPGTFARDTAKFGLTGNPDYYKGKVIILMDEQTQSQAEYTCMGLSALPDVVKVGSQTAGADGNVTYFKLSQDMATGYTNLGVFYPNGDSTQRIGIVPDTFVRPTQAGIRAGRDEVFEKALQIAGCYPAGIKTKLLSENSFTLFPNPAHNQCTVNWDVKQGQNITEIEVKNVLGQRVFNKKISTASRSESINTSGFAPGIYIITALSDQQILFNDKIVVQH